MTLVEVEDVKVRAPRPLTDVEVGRAGVLIGDAERLIRSEFGRARRDFDREVTDEWFADTVRRVMLEMVLAAVLIGPNMGMRSATSTTGAVSDSATFTDTVDGAASWAGVRLTDVHRDDLGLRGGSLPRGRFPVGAPVWPESRVEVRRVHR